MGSRARIISAILELTEAGHLAVSAEQVAAHADVGLRTVFRHFRDMDSLYREMAGVIETRLRAQIPLTYESETWRGRLVELIRRRSRVFETITPFRRAAALQRHRSPWADQDQARLSVQLRAILRDLTPQAVVADATLFEALDMLLSFEVWERLRREQGLEPDRACAVIERSAEALLRDAPPQ